MTSTRLLTIAFCSTLALAACGPQPVDNSGGVPSSIPTTPSETTNENIHVASPTAHSVVTSPLTVQGIARGSWYFEATFPVKLLDAHGNVIVSAPAQAQGDWMTDDFVPFTVTLTFTQPATPNGTLVLEKDNPSGLPEHDASIQIPVLFQ